MKKKYSETTLLSGTYFTTAQVGIETSTFDNFKLIK